MKNKFILTASLILVLFSFYKVANSNEFIFETNEINISEKGNITEATEGTAKSIKKKFLIKAKKFRYNNELSILIAFDGIAYSPDDNLEINADNFIYNDKKHLLETKGNVVIKDITNNISIKSQSIFFDNKNKIISSKVDSVIKDNLGNIFLTKNFKYNVNTKIIKINGSKLTDNQQNKYEISKAFLDLNSNKLIGKDISINFNDKSFSAGNNPRLKGNSISTDSENSTITKGIFTTCKKTDDCPPWQLSAEEIKHDKKNKTINYKNAWLKIYDRPVLYFPKFFHPDPSVERQSGFLMPSFKGSTNSGSSFQVPYYLVTGQNEDFTFTPRLFKDDKLLLQTEHRKVGNKSESIYDFSFLSEKNNSFKSHFFSKNKKNIELADFEESNIFIDLQQTSNDTYLKTYNIESPLITNPSLLTSTLGFSAYKEDLTFDTNFIVYEDLSKADSDRYEFVYPSYDLSKQFNEIEDFNGNFSFSSNGHQKNYDTNIFETVAVNDLLFNSNSNYTDQGFIKNYNFLLRNINTDSKNSSKYKENVDYKLASIMEYNVSYPLNKKLDNNTDILKPKISLKYSPNNNRNMRHENRRIDINNIFSLERLGAKDTVEGGTSFTYGLDYEKINKDEKEILGARVANILRMNEDKNLPNNSTLGQKTSNIVGDLNLSPNDNLNFKYNFLLDENLSDINYQSFETEFKVNNFITKFEYLNENNTAEKESFVSNTTSYTFDDSSKFLFKTRENKKTKITEFYNLIYEYRNDCLIAAIEYNKDYYTDRDLKPEENIFFKLTIVPFGATKSPNLLN
jgi:LPS-assembly protein